MRRCSYSNHIGTNCRPQVNEAKEEIGDTRLELEIAFELLSRRCCRGGADNKKGTARKIKIIMMVISGKHVHSHSCQAN